MFKQVSNIDELNNLVQNNEMVMVYFSQPTCSVCHGLKPQVEKKLAEFTDDMLFLDVNTLEVPEVTGEYQVMTVPVMLLFIDGKEYMRKARFIRMDELYQDVKKINNGVKSVNG